MYLGVTHKSVSVEERSYFAFNKTQRAQFISWIKGKINIAAISMISTCNRTEIYFESSAVTPYQVSDLLLSYVENLHGVNLGLGTDIFQVLNRTDETVNHLMYVANGLRSAVIGDKQIINQVKESYHEALDNRNQGSLLERAFQAVFRSHKRIFKETAYLEGSTSTAYSSLKLAASFFEQPELSKRSVLVIGAGEIIQDVLQYLPKFDFGAVAIANRTTKKAAYLSDKYGIQLYDWEKVEMNDFGSFDVIISAVSNRKDLIKSTGISNKDRLWIDLAMPFNINKDISDSRNRLYNIDEITSLVSEISDMQLEAIPHVEEIIAQELSIYLDWLSKSESRFFLKNCKINSKNVYLNIVPKTMQQPLTSIELDKYADILANRLVRKLVDTPNKLVKTEPVVNQLEVMHTLCFSNNKNLVKLVSENG